MATKVELEAKIKELEIVLANAETLIETLELTIQEAQDTDKLDWNTLIVPDLGLLVESSNGLVFIEKAGLVDGKIVKKYR